MVAVLAKIALTPALLALCTFVAHRWGDSIGGWLLGLPLTSGPVSVFLFAEHGTGFAEKAARATLLGVVAAAVFCACYVLASAKLRWWESLATAYALCLATAWTLSFVRVGLAETLVLVVATLLLLAAVTSASDDAPAAPDRSAENATDDERAARTGLLGRMVVAAASVVAITAIAGLLGPRVGGMLAPLPVLAAVMAASSHRRGARGEARGLLRGAIVGSWGGVAFFTVVAVMLPTSGPVTTYAIATLVALLVGSIAGAAQARGPVGSDTTEYAVSPTTRTGLPTLVTPHWGTLR